MIISFSLSPIISPFEPSRHPFLIPAQKFGLILGPEHTSKYHHLHFQDAALPDIDPVGNPQSGGRRGDFQKLKFAS